MITEPSEQLVLLRVGNKQSRMCAKLKQNRRNITTIAPRKLTLKLETELWYICHKKRKERIVNLPCRIMVPIAYWKYKLTAF